MKHAEQFAKIMNEIGHYLLIEDVYKIASLFGGTEISDYVWAVTFPDGSCAEFTVEGRPQTSEQDAFYNAPRRNEIKSMMGNRGFHCPICGGDYEMSDGVGAKLENGDIVQVCVFCVERCTVAAADLKCGEWVAKNPKQETDCKILTFNQLLGIEELQEEV